MEYYTNALKRGKSFYKSQILNNANPYLLVLDDLLPAGRADMGMDVGMMYIPSDLIVGTKTKGRTSVFSGNFMPLAEESTEFAYKWDTLANIHVEEGIRDPILVWEYMNRYYVQEGNKRASVLKFFEAPQILANVKRILPERTGDKDVELYYEFLEFFKHSKVNVLEFSKLGSYKELLTLLGKEENEYWTEDETRKFNSTYFFFKKSYLLSGGDSLKSTVGDAMLAYIRVFGYKELSVQGELEISRNLSKLWKEIVLLEEENQIEVKMDPTQKEGGSSLLSNLFYIKKKVAFIYSDDIQKSGWRKNHEEGRMLASSVLKDKIETKAYIAKNKSCEEIMVQAIKEGSTIIFATGSTMWKDCLKLAVEYPNVRFFNCSLNKPSKVISSYYPRMYEGKFISGAIAGSLTKTNKIGYICKYPIYGAIAEVNAFTRGVNLVNPNAKVHVYWMSVDGLDGSEEKCLAAGCDLVSYRDYGNQEEAEKRKIGLAYFENGVKHFVGVPIWNWGVFYEKILRSIIDGSMERDDLKTKKALNYYWGISAGVIDYMYGKNLPNSIRYLGEVLYRSIEHGICDPFYNPDINPNGTFQSYASGKKYTIEELIKMDKFEENVVGEIPKFSQYLDEVTKEVIKNVGVDTAKD